MTHAWRFGHAGHHPAPPHSQRAHKFMAVKETIATLREVVLMPRDLSAVVPTTKRGDDVVVLVHGFFASAGVFRPLKQRLERETGAVVASFTHAPGVGVARIAKSLKRLVDELPTDTRVHLVGHSLGGLVSRYYVQELGGHRRVVQTISLGSPFGGTKHADVIPIFVGRDLTTSSATLHRLRSRAGEFDIPHTSIVAGSDTVVVPTESAVFPLGDVVLLHGRGHNSLLYDRESMDAVVHRIRTCKK